MLVSLVVRYYRIAVVLAAGGYLWLISVSAFASLMIESGPGGAAGLSWSELRLSYRFAGDTTSGWNLAADGLKLVDMDVGLGRIELACPDGSLALDWPECDKGTLQWQPDGFDVLSGRFRSYWDEANSPAVEITFTDPDVHATAAFTEAGMAVAVAVNDVPIELITAPLAEALPLAHIDGQISGRAEIAPGDSGNLSVIGSVTGLAFDTDDGTYAAGDVRLAFDAMLTPETDGWRFRIGVSQEAGEWLFGPVYVPSPEQTVKLDAEGRFSGSRLELDRVSLQDPGVLSLSGGLAIELEESPTLLSMELQSLQMQLPGAQERYLNGLLAEVALDDLVTAGTVNGQLRLDQEGIHVLDLAVTDLSAEDARGRFGISGLIGRLTWREAEDQFHAALDWAGAGLHNIPLGPARLRLSGEGGNLSLTEPLTVPLFDGALRVDRLEWSDWRGEAAHLDVDARLEPVDFSPLSLALGWPELGGSVSGVIPGLRYADNILSFAGGVEIEAFSGRINVRGLAIERPFGTLPGLTADIEFRSLDLLEVTGAFGFGRMEGLLDGYINGLRMLDWQPVAFDARLATGDTAGVRRRISQRAVDNLSSLGGGSAALTAPFLRLFEDFSYRKVGISCRLSNNVCHMGGVDVTEDGGFVIVQGSGLPRLNIIGYRRLVDWPQLVRQLQAATEAEVR